MQPALAVPTLRRRLLAWYDRHARDLPWRGRDVYGVWVSEAMLQQTRVDVVIPFYQRWMERWPTVGDLAAADGDDIARHWAGLGYYARARNLHAAAQRIAREGWPADRDGWRQLPGVGPYTAAAVTSIALGQPNACVDGNVVRVIARLAGETGNVRAAATRKRIETLAQSWLAPRRPGDWNQALMDLGATVCTPRNPRCTQCPVAPLCVAKTTGKQEQIPRSTRPTKPRVERKSFALVQRGDDILFVRRSHGLLAGMWLLPGGVSKASLARAVQRQTGQGIHAGDLLGQARHTFSHRVWHMDLHTTRTRSDPGRRDAFEQRWIARGALDGEAIPAAMRVLLAASGIAAKPKSRGGSATA